MEVYFKYKIIFVSKPCCR